MLVFAGGGHPCRYSDKALFRKFHLPAVKEELGPGATKTDFKGELDKRWAAASHEEKMKWEVKQAEDQKRFEREQAVYEAKVRELGGDGAHVSASGDGGGGDSGGGGGGSSSGNGSGISKKRPKNSSGVIPKKRAKS